MIKAVLPLLGLLLGAVAELVGWRRGGPTQKGTKL